MKATAAKGAWRAITNETYGSVKAADWIAPVPAGGPAAEGLAATIAECEVDIADASGSAGDLQRQLGEIVAAARQRAHRDCQISDLSVKADQLPKAQESVARAG